MPTKKQTAVPVAMASSFSSLSELEETDDGWVILPDVTATAASNKSRGGKPPRPPPRGRPSSPCSSVATSANAAASDVDQTFDPAPEDIVGRYLPLRRGLRCDGLPKQIHDADVYGAHPGFLAAVYPAANDRFEWFFFVCRGRCPGGRRRAGPGAYRIVSEAKLLGGNAYCHAFRYYEDTGPRVGSVSAAKETEWRMDEYGDRGSAGAGAAAAAFDMVVCKVYPVRGGVIHQRLASPSRRRADADAGADKPQVLVQLYLDSLNLGDPRRSRMYAVADVCSAHPGVLTAVLPAANDRCEWFFAARRARADEDGAHPRRAGPGAYVPVRDCRVADGKRGDMGYRRVYCYREDDATVWLVSRTEWWMEEYGLGPDFPYGDLPAAVKARVGENEEPVVYKVYLKMAGDRR